MKVKKLLIGLLVSGLALSFTGCGDDGTITKEGNKYHIFGQFVDNFIFSALAFAVFAKFYTFPTLIGIALLGALIELFFEVFCKKWQSEGVGKDYFDYCKEMELRKDPSRFEFNKEENL